jgi:hypothetical protein
MRAWGSQVIAGLSGGEGALGMHFTRLQVALLGVAIGLAVLAAGRVMTVWLDDLKVVVFHQQPDD